MPSKTSFAPLTNAELLDAEFRWLRARARRLVAEKDARQARERECFDAPRPGRPTARDSRLQVVALRQREDRLRHEADARLHSSKRAAVKLGLQVLCQRHGLSFEERTILLIAAAPMVSQQFAETVVGDAISFYGATSIADCCLLLEAQSVGDWLRLRSLFTAESKLVKAGLIEVASPQKKAAATLVAASEVSVSPEVFALITEGGESAGGEP